MTDRRKGDGGGEAFSSNSGTAIDCHGAGLKVTSLSGNSDRLAGVDGRLFRTVFRSDDAPSICSNIVGGVGFDCGYLLVNFLGIGTQNWAPAAGKEFVAGVDKVDDDDEDRDWSKIVGGGVVNNVGGWIIVDDFFGDEINRDFASGPVSSSFGNWILSNDQSLHASSTSFS